MHTHTPTHTYTNTYHKYQQAQVEQPKAVTVPFVESSVSLSRRCCCCLVCLITSMSSLRLSRHSATFQILSLKQRSPGICKSYTIPSFIWWFECPASFQYGHHVVVLCNMSWAWLFLYYFVFFTLTTSRNGKLVK